MMVTSCLHVMPKGHCALSKVNEGPRMCSGDVSTSTRQARYHLTLATRYLARGSSSDSEGSGSREFCHPEQSMWHSGERNSRAGDRSGKRRPASARRFTEGFLLTSSELGVRRTGRGRAGCRGLPCRMWSLRRVDVPLRSTARGTMAQGASRGSGGSARSRHAGWGEGPLGM